MKSAFLYITIRRMNERGERLKIIREIITSQKVKSQEILVKLLKKHSFEVTQGTLSRDLKTLKVKKNTGKDGEAYYTMPSDEDFIDDAEVWARDFMRGYVSVEWREPIVVIKTYSGYANSVSNALDNLEFQSVLGTVAGDNCLFVCLKKGFEGKDFSEELERRIKGVRA